MTVDWEKMDLEDIRRKTTALQAIQEEFRRLSVLYLPIFHEKFESGLDVSPEGWDAFISAHRNESQWEEWYQSWSHNSVGRFYGCRDGFEEFRKLADSVLNVLGYEEVHETLIGFKPAFGNACLLRIYGRPHEIWAEVLHLMARHCQTPLLYTDVYAFGLTDQRLLFDDTVDRSSLHAQEGTLPDLYPRHPLGVQLPFNVFSSSTETIRIIVEGGRVLTYRGGLMQVGQMYDEYGGLPFVFDYKDEKIAALDEEDEQTPCEIVAETDEQKLLLSDDPSLPQFLFRKVGDGFLVRFRTGESLEKAMIGDLKGCLHYQRLLQSPNKEIACVDLDPRKADGSAAGGSAVSQDEHRYVSGYDDDRSEAKKQRFRRDDKVSQSMIDQMLKLDGEIKDETDEANKERLRKIRSQVEASFRDYTGKERADKESFKAYNRVRKAMRQAREAMKRTKKLDRFVEHLKKSVLPLNQVSTGHGFWYAPENEPLWTF